MENSTQLVSLSEHNRAENCSEDGITSKLLSREALRTSESLMFQVIIFHIPGTVALNRTVELLRTAVLAGSSLKSWDRTEQKKEQM